MVDISWISAQAQEIHAFFVSIFYAVVTLLLAIGVVAEYFKLPLGGTPQFSLLVGRVFVACILLIAYPDISNAVASVADAIAAKIGSFNDVDRVLSAAGETLKNHSWSWTSLADSLLWLVTYLAYFLLYVTVFFFDAAIIYCMVLLYIFSPLMIALYVLPQTAAITGGLFRTLFEIACWKIVWAVLANLLWSAALNNFSRPDSAGTFITQLALTLMLAFSVMMTPMVVKALISGALSSVATKTAGYAAMGLTAGMASPTAVTGLLTTGSKKLAAGAARKSGSGLKRGFTYAAEYKRRRTEENIKKANLKL